MSRSPEGEFAPNPGLPLPVITRATLDYMSHRYSKVWELGRTGKKIFRQDLASKTADEDLALLGKDPELLAWLNAYVEQQGVEPHETGKRFRLEGLALGNYRALYKQAEAKAMEDNLGVVDEQLLPFVKPGALQALPFEQVESDKFIPSVLAVMEADGNELLSSRLWKMISLDSKNVRVACAIYWLLKYHSKPRGEKQT